MIYCVTWLQSFQILSSPKMAPFESLYFSFILPGNLFLLYTVWTSHGIKPMLCSMSHNQWVMQWRHLQYVLFRFNKVRKIENSDIENFDLKLSKIFRKFAWRLFSSFTLTRITFRELTLNWFSQWVISQLNHQNDESHCTLKKLNTRESSRFIILNGF